MTDKLRQLKESGAVHYTEAEIHGFFEEYRWLSNFHICPVLYDGVMYPSSENAYQAAKFGKGDEIPGIGVVRSATSVDTVNARSYLSTVSPSESRKLGQLAEMDPELWDMRKKEVMREVLLDKFTRNLDLRQKLIATGTAHLEETNWWGDTYYGVCNGIGKNVLGELLMDVRDILLTVVG